MPSRTLTVYFPLHVSKPSPPLLSHPNWPSTPGCNPLIGYGRKKTCWLAEAFLNIPNSSSFPFIMSLPVTFFAEKGTNALIRVEWVLPPEPPTPRCLHDLTEISLKCVIRFCKVTSWPYALFSSAEALSGGVCFSGVLQVPLHFSSFSLQSYIYLFTSARTHQSQVHFKKS